MNNKFLLALLFPVTMFLFSGAINSEETAQKDNDDTEEATDESAIAPDLNLNGDAADYWFYFGYPYYLGYRFVYPYGYFGGRFPGGFGGFRGGMMMPRRGGPDAGQQMGQGAMDQGRMGQEGGMGQGGMGQGAMGGQGDEDQAPDRGGPQYRKDGPDMGKKSY